MMGFVYEGLNLVDKLAIKGDFYVTARFPRLADIG
jgi:hypothetical protein